MDQMNYTETYEVEVISPVKQQPNQTNGGLSSENGNFGTCLNNMSTVALD